MLGRANRGAAYVFARSGSSWSQKQELVTTDGTKGDSFGSSVTVSGDTAVVGAMTKAANRGTAYVFVLAGRADTDVRSGSRSPNLWGNRGAFGDLDIHVFASEAAGGPRVVVKLDKPGASGASCFVAPKGMSVSLDGEPLVMRFAGGEATAETATFMFQECASAVFESNTALARPDLSTVVVEVKGSRAEMTVLSLLARRSVSVRPSSVVHPGDHIVLQSLPSTDEWSGEGLGTHVYVYFPSQFGTEIALDRGLNISRDSGEFRFTFPNVRPGPARITLYTQNLAAHPLIKACRGANRCFTEAGAWLSFETEVVVAPMVAP